MTKIVFDNIGAAIKELARIGSWTVTTFPTTETNLNITSVSPLFVIRSKRTTFVLIYHGGNISRYKAFIIGEHQLNWGLFDNDTTFPMKTSPYPIEERSLRSIFTLILQHFKPFLYIFWSITALQQVVIDMRIQIFAET